VSLEMGFVQSVVMLSKKPRKRFYCHICKKYRNLDEKIINGGLKLRRSRLQVCKTCFTNLTTGLGYRKPRQKNGVE